MRFGSVIGRVTLSRATPALKGGRWLIVSPATREHFPSLAARKPAVASEPSLVVYDSLGGGVGDVVGIEEGREAAMPFKEPTPIDAINVAIVDTINYTPL